MRTFTKEELDKIIENHWHWIHEDCDGWESMRADLRSADLRSADLRSANLRSANLRSADLRSADLSSANLYGANLYGADLSGANLYGSDLSGANLYGADLRSADLRSADLRSADLRSADLRSADLRSADLRSADLYGADLRSANLYGANLSSADLRSADLRSADLRSADLSSVKSIPFIPMACPDVGSFTGWKNCTVLCGENLDVEVSVIVELEIPAYAKRSSAMGRKCRCDKAIVKSITSIDSTKSFDSAFSKRDPNFIYKVGGVVSIDNFDENRFNECAPGIHFFINRQEAVDYEF